MVIMSDTVVNTETLPERCPGCGQGFEGWMELFAHTTTCGEYRELWIQEHFGGNPSHCGHLDLSMDWKGDLRPEKEGHQPTAKVWLVFQAHPDLLRSNTGRNAPQDPRDIGGCLSRHSPRRWQIGAIRRLSDTESPLAPLQRVIRPSPPGLDSMIGPPQTTVWRNRRIAEC